MNKSIFSGNLCFDIEERTAGQTKVSNNTLAVTKYYKGDKQTVFVPLTFWGKTVDLLSQYCKKGSKLLVTCEFKIDEWEKDGQKQQKPNFTVLEMEFIGGGQQNSQQPTQDNFQNNQRQTPDTFDEDD